MFEIRNGVLEKYHGKSKKVIVPDSVTCIGEGAFKGCRHLVSVTIPGSVTSIGKGAFWNCDRLKSVNIPDSVLNIEECAFRGCDRLKSVTIGNCVTNIGESAFSGCVNLTSIIIPDSVKIIGERAFEDCESLKSVTIGNNVTIIEEYTFANCDRLKSVTFGNNVTSIGNLAFYGCTTLKSVTMGNGVTSIGSSAFYGCDGLDSVIIDKFRINLPRRSRGYSTAKYNELKSEIMYVAGLDDEEASCYISEILDIQERSDDGVDPDHIFSILIKNDYSIEMDNYLKFYLIFQMFAFGLDEEKVSAYISENFSAMFPVLININNTKILQKILDSEKIITNDNIDTLIRYAVDQKKRQMKHILTYYKQKNWYHNFDDTNEK